MTTPVSPRTFQPRLAHTMLRVKDLEASLRFYCDTLGMQILRRTDFPEGKFTNTFIGYGPEHDYPALELTYNWGRADPYEQGEAYGHVAVEVDDVYAFCDHLAQQGVTILRPPGPMKHGRRVLAFVADPDGYKVEVTQPYVAERDAPSAPTAP